MLVAFRCGLLNIGAEGQLYIGAFATAWVGITFANLSPWLLIPMCFLAAILGGGVWGAIPMPPNPGVSDDEMKQLLAWILSQD